MALILTPLPEAISHASPRLVRQAGAGVASGTDRWPLDVGFAHSAGLLKAGIWVGNQTKQVLCRLLERSITDAAFYKSLQFI